MRTSLSVLAAILALAACGTGERPFRMVQFCLADSSEIEEMNAVLRGVAAANKLPFVNNSIATEEGFNSAAARIKNLPVAHPTVNVGTVGPNRMGFSAGNFPDAPSQIVVGFSKGSDVIAARKLSEDVVQALRRRWSIHEVPNVETSGALPLKHCNG